MSSEFSISAEDRDTALSLLFEEQENHAMNVGERCRFIRELTGVGLREAVHILNWHDQTLQPKG